MSDLNKIMAKMNTNKKPVEQPTPAPAENVAPATIPAPVEVPVEQPAPIENVPQSPANVPQPAPTPAPVEVNDDDDDDDVDDLKKVDINREEEVKQVPTKQEDDQHSIEQEVAVLQNVGIFRREMVLIEREKVDVLKVMAQTLLDIKKKLLGEEDAPKK